MKKTILFLFMFVFTCTCLLQSNVYARDYSDVEIITDTSEKIGYNDKKTEYLAGKASSEDEATKSKTTSTKKKQEKKLASNKKVKNKTSNTNNTDYNKNAYIYNKEYNPKTSDDSYINLAIGCMLVSFVGISSLVCVKRKKNFKKF